ncbi:MAG: hypothetical protein ACHQJ6_02720 [Candidatus Berkiellales bacterium]
MRNLSIQEIAQISGGIGDGLFDGPEFDKQRWSWRTWGFIAGGMVFVFLYDILRNRWQGDGNDRPQVPPRVPPAPVPLLWPHAPAAGAAQPAGAIAAIPPAAAADNLGVSSRVRLG